MAALMSGSFQCVAAGFSHSGKVREHNEDAILNLSADKLWAVADGMGGYDFGDIASQMALQAIKAQPLHGSLSQRVQLLKQALNKVNHHLSEEKTLAQSQLVGTTLCLLHAHQGQAVCVWAGDSRCYLLRQSRLFQLSRDHSASKQGRHVITQAIGMGAGLALEHVQLQLQEEDTLLLTSDGTHDYLEELQLIQAMSETSPHAGQKWLFEQVMESEARDNCSALMIRIKRL